MRRRHQLANVLTGGSQQFLRYVVLNPASHLQLGFALQLEERFLTGVGVANDFPGVAGHLGLMNQDGADGPLALGFFVFVGPAAVVGERLSFEKLGIGGGRLADQHEHYFALHVGALVVIPIVLGSFNAVADEDDGSVDG